jgi:hypothetical protein
MKRLFIAMQDMSIRSSRHGLLASVTDAIDNTPLVELRHVGARTHGRIVA